LPPKKAARYRDKAKPLVSCANGFAVFAALRESFPDVRYWHKADIELLPGNVRFRG
jgi:hypothetical protein